MEEEQVLPLSQNGEVGGLVRLVPDSDVALPAVYTLPEKTGLDPDTPVYYFEATGDGTYFANGLLVRHELPNFNLWPETMLTLDKTLRGIVPKVRSSLELKGFDRSHQATLKSQMKEVATAIYFSLVKLDVLNMVPFESSSATTKLSEKAQDAHSTRCVPEAPVPVAVHLRFRSIPRRSTLHDLQQANPLQVLGHARKLVGCSL